jgi:hypothetical protein
MLSQLGDGMVFYFFVLIPRPAKEVQIERLEFVFAALYVEFDALVGPGGNVLFGERHLVGRHDILQTVPSLTRVMYGRKLVLRQAYIRRARPEAAYTRLKD